MLTEVLHSVQLFCVNLFTLCDIKQLLSFLSLLCFNLSFIKLLLIVQVILSKRKRRVSYTLNMTVETKATRQSGPFIFSILN